MDHKQPRRHIESDNTKKIVHRMKQLGWDMVRMGAGKYQASGMPDWYAMHPKYGSRWIEMKSYTGKLRATQKRMFKRMADCGIGVWVLVVEEDYPLLMGKPNWWRYV